MNKQTVKIFTIIAVFNIVFKITSFFVSRFTEWFTLYLILDALNQLCFLTLVFFISRDLQNNYLKQLWQVYVFIGYSILLSIFTLIFQGSISYLSAIGLLYLVIAINVAVFFINSVYQLFGIVFLAVIFLHLLVPWIFAKFFPQYSSIANYLGLLPLLYPVVLLYIVRTEVNKVFEQADSIASIKAER